MCSEVRADTMVIMNNVTVSDQLQQMWRTRPHRLPQRGHVAGVAAGIGYRYDVDPVLIRVAFVVSTLFGGTGIVLYLAAWLVLSRAGDSASGVESMVGRGHSSDSTTKTVVVAVALVIALSTLGPAGVGLGGSGVISLAAMLGGLWLLHQRCPEPPPYLRTAEFTRQQYAPTPFGSSTTSAEQWSAAQYRPPQFQYEQYTPYTTLPKSYEPTPQPVSESGSAPTVDLTKSTRAESISATAVPTTPQAVTPPSWDPLGVAPFAWDLPEPAGTFPPAAIERKRRSRWTASFLGLALLGAAVTTGLGGSDRFRLDHSGPRRCRRVVDHRSGSDPGCISPKGLRPVGRRRAAGRVRHPGIGCRAGESGRQCVGRATGCPAHRRRTCPRL